MKQAALVVAGLFFGLIALIQFTRLYLDFPIVIGNTPIPIWASAIAFAVMLVLSLWMFYTASKE